MRLVEAHALHGSLLDFGAGRGELLQQLHQRGRFSRLTGVDLFARPATGLASSVQWIQQDLNQPLEFAGKFDVVICSEVIEHLENPRQTFRILHAALQPGGTLILTMPNQESVRSYASLLLRGHFISFVDSCYPAHITALLRKDLIRISHECGFENPVFSYSNHGLVPKLNSVTWQRLSLGLLAGRLYSDNLGLWARKPNKGHGETQ
jgi:2-polyprenyl-3-methyl-5-hydroxy-6-metoxy-1,4-benzoquinol methylase